jgi:hypothetical protein
MQTVQLVRHFWIAGIVVAALNAAIYWFRARRAMRENPEDASALRAIIAYVTAWIGLPAVLMGIGILSGSTHTPFDYLYPRQGDPYVVGFHVVTVVGALGAMYWVLARGGMRILDQYSQVFMGRRWDSDIVRLRVFAAIAAPLLIAVCLWLGLAPKLPPELTALPN